MKLIVRYEVPPSIQYSSVAKLVIEQGAKAVRCSRNTAASVSFIGDAKMRMLNRQYRGKDRTTNVLSFHGSGADLGDIFISISEAKREAKKYGWTIQYEIARLALHGFLHLLGYDHEREKDAKKMEGIEGKILQPLSLRGAAKRRGNPIP